jgi:hypothetical protein
VSGHRFSDAVQIPQSNRALQATLAARQIFSARSATPGANSSPVLEWLRQPSSGEKHAIAAIFICHIPASSFVVLNGPIAVFVPCTAST